MSRYTQANRPLRVDSILGEDALLLASFSGSESVSHPFSYRIEMYSEDAEIDGRALLRTPLSVTVKLDSGGERTIHGLVRSFTQMGRAEELTSYRAEIVPWLWFLGLSRECRIHQEMNALEIVETVFGDLGFADYDIRCATTPPTREYCVQYRESHLDFVSRLLEEEGICYFFEHEADKHTLVLADVNSAFPEVTGPYEVRLRSQGLGKDDVVTWLERSHSVHVGKVSLRDYDYLQPNLSLHSTLEGEAPEEIYDYHPGRYRTPEEGERHARIILQEQEARGEVVQGRANCRSFESGRAFELQGHYRDEANQEYLLVQVSLAARAGDYRSWGTAPMDYQVSFAAIPLSVPFRPARRTPRPTIRGSQTAEVVGKPGEEIWTDEHGRIKVQFHWDRVGEKDENSSCWVRVASHWAGKSWGALHLPRIGQEVVVEFLEGDPDRPLVTGSVYNDEHMPPYTLPDEQTRSGLRSRSSKGGGGHNEISIDDAKGSEQVTIHAQKDMSTTVLNDQTTSVGNNQSTAVGNDQEVTVGRDQVVSAMRDRLTTVGGDNSRTVGQNENVLVNADQNVVVAKDRSIRVVGTRSETVIRDAVTEVIGNLRVASKTGQLDLQAEAKSVNVFGAESVNLASPATVAASGKSIELAGTMSVSIDGQKISLTGKQEIVFQVGSNYVKIDPVGVTIFGTLVKIN
jgi:type VI secretion system secreted protein VgrG